jgi:hypothetical protein
LVVDKQRGYRRIAATGAEKRRCDCKEDEEPRHHAASISTGSSRRFNIVLVGTPSRQESAKEAAEKKLEAAEKARAEALWAKEDAEAKLKAASEKRPESQ